MNEYINNPQNIHVLIVQCFEKYLLGLFDMWISVPPTSKKIRKQIWQRFSEFTSSNDYNIMWNSLHTAMGVEGSPVLSFYITYNLFIRRWENKYPTKEPLHNKSNVLPHLTYDEQNALWYVAGYLLRQVKINLKKRKASDDILAMIESLEDKEISDTNDDGKEEILDSRKWFDLINRGGLN